MSRDAETVTLGQFAAVLRRRWRVLVLVVLLAVALGATYVAVSTPTFTSRAVVKVEPLVDDPLRNGEATDVSTVTEAKVVSSTSVAERVKTVLGERAAVPDLLDRVAVSSPVGSQVLEIRYSAASAEAAARGANAFAQAYLDYRRDTAETRLKARIDRLEAQRAALLTASRETASALAVGAGARQAELRAAQATNQRQVALLGDQIARLQTAQVVPGEVVDRGLRPGGDGRPPLAVALPGSLLVGLVLGAVAALWRHRTDTRVGTAKELEVASGAPVLASLAVSSGSGSSPRTGTGSGDSDGYRLVVGKLIGAGHLRPGGVLLVSPSSDAHGDVARGLSSALAARGLPVALVTCGPGKGLRPSAGSPAAAVDARTGSATTWRRSDTDAGVQVLDIGPEDQVESFLEREGSGLRDLLAGHAAFVVDASSVRTSTALALASLTSSTVVVAERWRTTTEDVERLRRDLEHVGNRCVGAVLTDTVVERRRVELKPRGTAEPAPTGPAAPAGPASAAGRGDGRTAVGPGVTRASGPRKR